MPSDSHNTDCCCGKQKPTTHFAADNGSWGVWVSYALWGTLLKPPCSQYRWWHSLCVVRLLVLVSKCRLRIGLVGYGKIQRVGTAISWTITLSLLETYTKSKRMSLLHSPLPSVSLEAMPGTIYSAVWLSANSLDFIFYKCKVTNELWCNVVELPYSHHDCCWLGKGTYTNMHAVRC